MAEAGSSTPAMPPPLPAPATPPADAKKASPKAGAPGWNDLWLQVHAVLQCLGTEHMREVQELHAKIAWLEGSTCRMELPSAEPSSAKVPKVSSDTPRLVPPDQPQADPEEESEGHAPSSARSSQGDAGAEKSCEASPEGTASAAAVTLNCGAGFTPQTTPGVHSTAALQYNNNGSYMEHLPEELPPCSGHQDGAPPISAMMALSSLTPGQLEPFLDSTQAQAGAPPIGALIALTAPQAPVALPLSLAQAGSGHWPESPGMGGPQMLQPGNLQLNNSNFISEGSGVVVKTSSNQMHTRVAQNRLPRCSLRPQAPERKMIKKLTCNFEDEYDNADPTHRQVRCNLKDVWQKALSSINNEGRTKKSEHWSEQATEAVQAKLSKQLSSSPEHHFESDEKKHCLERTLRRFVAHPSCRWRLIWDLLGMMFLSFDLVMIPLQVYGDVADMNSPVLVAISWLTSIYWTGDMFTSFFVGFHTRGSVEMSPKRIAARYLRTWFPLDITLVLVDWTFISMGFSQQASYMRVGKTMSRGMRVLRLLRIVKMHAVFAELMERVRSEYVRTMMSIGNLIGFIIIINHFIACGWYGLQYLNVANMTWNEKYLRAQHGLGYRYATSLHWSLTQFTPASMEVVPANGVERVYSVCVLLFALITFSSFVSSITQAMTHLRNINARKLEQQQVLRRYLNQHGISGQLVNRVWHYLHLRVVQNSVKVRTKEHQVPMLDLLPLSMRVELRVESFTPELNKHPFFFIYGHFEPAALRAMCNRALSELSLINKQELFSAESHKVQMFFVAEGVLEYMLPCNCAARDNIKALETGEEREDATKLEKIQNLMDNELMNGTENAGSWSAEHSLEFVSKCDRVAEGRWACELALWSSRLELCSPFVATERSEILLLSSEELQEIIMKYKDSSHRATKYAAAFVEHVSTTTRCRWRAAINNDFSIIQDLAHRAVGFQSEKKRVGVKRHRLSLTNVDRRKSISNTIKCMVSGQPARGSTASAISEAPRQDKEQEGCRPVSGRMTFFQKLQKSNHSRGNSKIASVDEPSGFSHIA